MKQTKQFERWKKLIEQIEKDKFNSEHKPKNKSYIKENKKRNIKKVKL